MRGKWHNSYPELRESHDPAMLSVDEVKIKPVEMNDIGLGKSIYTKKQLDEFAAFQDSQELESLTWQIPLSWPIWEGTRKESGVWHWGPRPICPLSTSWG